jgi:hypothetical protein
VPDKVEQQDALFINLVLMFQNAAMQQLGKIANPMTGKTERNLDQARFSIDMIEMLRSKTRGNLSDDLERLINTTLTNLRMNYVDEAGKKPSDEGEVEEEAEEAAPKAEAKSSGQEPVEEGLKDRQAEPSGSEGDAKKQD